MGPEPTSAGVWYFTGAMPDVSNPNGGKEHTWCVNAKVAVKKTATGFSPSWPGKWSKTKIEF